MRPYRGKRIDNSEWVYGWYSQQCVGEDSFIGIIYELPGLFPVEVIPETVGQQIGCKDKNEEEMYFDDIVIWNGKKYVIVWSKTCLGIYLEHFDSYLARQKDPKLGKFIENLMYGRAVYSEVISNIHEEKK